MDEKTSTARAIQEAIQSGNVGRVKNLIGPNEEMLKMMTPFGTWLHVAASAGALGVVKELVRMGLDVNTRGGTFKGNALNVAATGGYVDVVRHLLKCGAEMDTSEPERNPLFGAIYGGHPEVVRVLIESGIDPHVRYTGTSMSDMDAYGFAIERGQATIAEMLKAN